MALSLPCCLGGGRGAPQRCPIALLQAPRRPPGCRRRRRAASPRLPRPWPRSKGNIEKLRAHKGKGLRCKRGVQARRGRCKAAGRCEAGWLGRVQGWLGRALGAPRVDLVRLAFTSRTERMNVTSTPEVKLEPGTSGSQQPARPAHMRLYHRGYLRRRVQAQLQRPTASKYLLAPLAGIGLPGARRAVQLDHPVRLGRQTDGQTDRAALVERISSSGGRSRGILSDATAHQKAIETRARC